MVEDDATAAAPPWDMGHTGCSALLAAGETQTDRQIHSAQIETEHEWLINKSEIEKHFPMRHSRLSERLNEEELKASRRISKVAFSDRHH